MALTPEEMSLRGKLAAHVMWSKVPDRSARTAPGRAAFDARFEKQVDPGGVMDPETRRKAAESAKKAHFARMAFRSAQVRSRKARERTDGNGAAAGR